MYSLINPNKQMLDLFQSSPNPPCFKCFVSFTHQSWRLSPSVQVNTIAYRLVFHCCIGSRIPLHNFRFPFYLQKWWHLKSEASNLLISFDWLIVMQLIVFSCQRKLYTSLCACLSVCRQGVSMCSKNLETVTNVYVTSNNNKESDPILDPPPPPPLAWNI